MAKLRNKIIPPDESPRTSGGFFYYVSSQWAKILEGLIEPLYQNYRWDFDAGGDVLQARNWSLEIDRFTLDDIKTIYCDPPTYNPPCETLPECIEIDNDDINIYLDRCDMTINIFQSCGCGNSNNGGGNCGCNGGNNGGYGGGGSFGGGQSSGGGASGSWLSEPDISTTQDAAGITQCDFVTTMIPLVMDSLTEFTRLIDNNSESVGDIMDALATAAGVAPLLGNAVGTAGQFVTAVLESGSAAVATMLLDQDFRYQVAEAWVRAHSNDGNISSVTRADFRATTQYLPLTRIESGVVLYPRVIFDGLWSVLSVNKVNSRLSIAKGTANEQLCNYIWAGAGITYEAPVDQSTLPVPPLVWSDDTYTITQINTHNGTQLSADTQQDLLTAASLAGIWVAVKPFNSIGEHGVYLGDETDQGRYRFDNSTAYNRFSTTLQTFGICLNTTLEDLFSTHPSIVDSYKGSRIWGNIDQVERDWHCWHNIFNGKIVDIVTYYVATVD